MIDTEELAKLRAAKPHLFDVENPIEGLAAVKRAANEYQLLLRAIGTLKRSYSARIAKSPFLSANRDKIAAETQAKIDAMKARDAKPEPVAGFTPHMATDEETDDLMADLSAFMRDRK